MRLPIAASSLLATTAGLLGTAALFNDLLIPSSSPTLPQRQGTLARVQMGFHQGFRVSAGVAAGAGDPAGA